MKPAVLKAIDLSDDSGPCCDAELHHNQVDETLHGVRADIHPLRYFLACETLGTKHESFALTRRKFVPLAYSTDVFVTSGISFQNDGDSCPFACVDTLQ